MTIPSSFKILGTGLAGLLTGGAVAYMLLTSAGYTPLHNLLPHTHNDAYHVHADLLIMMNGERIKLTDKKYQSYLDHVLHPGVHLHDENDTVIHFHAPNITLIEFFSSLGLSLTTDCLTKEDRMWCTDENAALTLYVNGTDRTEDLSTYVPMDEDRILLYYGPRNAAEVPTLLDQVTTDACIYSGTCPERGTAPPESCGLTCEL